MFINLAPILQDYLPINLDNVNLNYNFISFKGIYLKLQIHIPYHQPHLMRQGSIFLDLSPLEPRTFFNKYYNFFTF
jgi:hypothetical protein